MSEKNIPRKVLNDGLRLNREFFAACKSNDDAESLRILREIGDLCDKTFEWPNPRYWFGDLVRVVIKFKEDATAEDLETVLALLGWEVTDEPAEC